jgi:hypothetical protein
MTTLSTYGALTTKSLKCETDLTFQTANSNSTVFRATDGSGDQIITIAAQSGNSTLLTSESSVAGGKVDINSTAAEGSLADTDTFLFYDASATANKKVTGANLKTYVGAGSGVPSGTNGQVIVYDAGNSAASVAMSGDISIVANGTTTIGSNKITTAMVQDDAITAAKLANDAVVNASVASGAAIAYSKLSLSNSIVAGDLTADCVTAVKLADNAVVNASVDASAAIAYSKLNLSTSIVAGDLATDSVETLKIANNAVTNNKIAGLSGVTAGTVTALKLMLPDASKDLSGFRNLTSTGDNQSASVLIGTSEWKIVNSGTDLLFQKWNSGTSAWVTKSTISGA